MKESIVYYSVKAFGFLIRRLPLRLGLAIGNGIGVLAYYLGVKHKSQAYANLKIAFADSKTPAEIKQITRRLFKNYGQNLIELFRMPLLTPEKFDQVVEVEGKEHVMESLKQGKGAIIVAMHFGSWELASLTCAMLGFPYKVFVKPQVKYSRLDNLLNAYRARSGSAVLSRGSGTRDFVRGLKNNEVVGMVVDQGGRDGVLVPFFGRPATMSVGAIRMGLKLGVPICFSTIFRRNGSRHRMIIHRPFELQNTGDLEADVIANLKAVVQVMEGYIRAYPSEYMWFYKIWKYSNKADIVILSDGKTGHFHQSQSVAQAIQAALSERNIVSTARTVPVIFKSRMAARLLSIAGALIPPQFYQGRLECLKYFLAPDSYRQITSAKGDFIVSCGSSIAAVNNLVSRDSCAKSIVVLRPGLLGYDRFDLAVLPKHDEPRKRSARGHLAITHVAPNLVTQDYLQEQSRALLSRFSHLKDNLKAKIGLFIGGTAKTVFLSERQIKILIRQLKEALTSTNMDILITTSRRTPARIENLFQREFKKFPACPLLILANREDVSGAAGGILALSDIVIVSGDSLSMVSEAASSGKKTIVFSPQTKAKVLKGPNKHLAFISELGAKGYVWVSPVHHIGQSIYDMAKGKIQTGKVDDRDIILQAVRKIV